MRKALDSTPSTKKQKHKPKQDLCLVAAYFFEDLTDKASVSLTECNYNHSIYCAFTPVSSQQFISLTIVHEDVRHTGSEKQRPHIFSHM
jgi:hypothetical protein